MKRSLFLQDIQNGFAVHSVVAILGPRQSGKTTLARQYIDSVSKTHKVHYFDLDNPNDVTALATPFAILEHLIGVIVIDEIQNVPELFPILRVLVDKIECKQQYLILGSASLDLIRQSSETLAGRIEYIELPPFQYSEVQDLEKLWFRGGFPKSFLAINNINSERWRLNYIRTFLERDIPNLGINIPAANIRRLWQMLAHNHANILNASDIGRSLSITHTTVRHYLDILIGTFMVRQLSPWHENISKRQVKSPKIYIRDSGILHSLLQIGTDVLLLHPKLGASWEGFALEEIIKHNRIQSSDCYFWATQNNAELDFFTVYRGKRVGYEFKFTDTPHITKSMRIAIEDLRLDLLYVIYPGQRLYQPEEKIIISGLRNYLDSSISDNS